MAYAVALAACGARSGLEPIGRALQGGDGGLGGSFAGVPVAGGVGLAGAPRGGNSGAGVAMGAGSAGENSAGGSGGDAGDGGEAPCLRGARNEICNGVDDDCDGEIDEDLPFEVLDEAFAARTDEGRTDVGLPIDCTSCGWAWHPQLVMPDDELGVVWYLGIWGGREQPSGFVRQLSWELAPRGGVTSLGPSYWLSMLRRGLTRTGAELLTFVERKDSADLPSFARLGRGFQLGPSVPLDGCSSAAYGGLLAPLMPGLVSCASPGQLRTFALDDEGKGVKALNRYDLRLPGETKLEGGRAVAAMHGDSGLLAVPLMPEILGMTTPLWTQRISTQGAPVGEALRQDLDGPRALYLEGLFSTTDGYLLFGDDRRPGEWPNGRFVVPLDVDGRVNGDMTHYDQANLSGFDEVSVLRVGSGFVVAETTAQGLLVERLSATGSVLQLWQEAVPIYSEPSLLFAHGHLYVAYAEPPPLNGGENRVMVLRLGCAPQAR